MLAMGSEAVAAIVLAQDRVFGAAVLNADHESLVSLFAKE